MYLSSHQRTPCRGILFDYVFLLQVEEAKNALKKTKSEADAMELRNLGLMEVMTAAQLEEAEVLKGIMQSSTRKGTSRTKGTESTTELPSLVDVAKHTTDGVSL